MMGPRPRPAAMREQLFTAKQPVHGRFRGHVHAFVGQLGHDLAWGMVPKALAEAAALLVLRKKAEALWGDEDASMESKTDDESSS